MRAARPGLDATSARLRIAASRVLTLAGRGAARIDADLDGHAERQPLVVARATIEDDLDGHALHDLHPVPGRVLRGQQLEARAGAGLNAVDSPPQGLVRIGIDPDLRGLTDPHARELHLLE